MINANQAGNSNYNAAPQVQQSFAVEKGVVVTNGVETILAGIVLFSTNFQRFITPIFLVYNIK